MKTSEYITAATATLRRRLYESRWREHRVVKAFGVLIVALCLIAIISSVSGASRYGNANVGSPVRPVAKPISGYRSDLVQTPNPMDEGNNLMITGNVAGGKHFQGTIPYSAPTNIKAPLGSTSLDSFMRYTTPAETSDRISGRYNSFYSSSGTAASLHPGLNSTLGPNRSTTTDLGRRTLDTTTDTSYLGMWSQSRVPTDNDPQLGDATLEASRRLSSWPSPYEIERERQRYSDERLTERRIPSPSNDLQTDEYKQQVQELQDRLGQVVAEMAELERTLESRKSQQPDLLALPEETTTTEPQRTAGSETPNSRRDALLQETARLLAATTGTGRQSSMLPPEQEPVRASETDAQPRLQLYRAPAGASEEVETESAARHARIESVFLPPAAVAQTAKVVPAPQQSQAADQKLDAPLGPIASYWPSPAEPAPSQTPEADSPQAQVGSGTAESGVRAQRVPVEMPASIQKAFADHLLAGQNFLAQGQYRRAADAFALASAYNPDDPRVHLGKSHALFGAREYASSAFFLAKAVELNAKYALGKTDLIAIAGGPDAFIARFNELAQKVETDGAPQLQFLLAYVYHQMDRPLEARTAIDAAGAKAPSSAAIGLLRNAINPR